MGKPEEIAATVLWLCKCDVSRAEDVQAALEKTTERFSWSYFCRLPVERDGDVTASARPPSSSIRRAVSWLPASETSAATTLAPSRAKANAVARPMPFAAPVTKATLPE